MSKTRTDLTPLAALAHLLDRLDTAATPADPLQYRLLATRTRQLLSDLSQQATAQEPLQALLRQSPALLTLYENLHYAEAGLCRSPLSQAVAAEVTLRQGLQRWRRSPAAPGTPQSDARAEPGTPA